VTAITEASGPETTLSPCLSCLISLFFFSRQWYCWHPSHPFRESGASSSALAVRYPSRTTGSSDRPPSCSGILGIWRLWLHDRA